MAILQRKKVKGKDYYYIVESKRINGKPTPVVIEYIGSTKNLYERLQNNRTENVVLKSYSHGDSYGLMKMAKKLDIEEILDKVFTKKISNGVKRSTSLILAAIHRACNPGSKNEFEEWFSGTTLPSKSDIKSEVMTSQHFWEQMDNISKEELEKAEDLITKKILNTYNIELDKIALDYTNYFTYIATDNEKSDLARRGKNKQKRNDLRQCSLAIITTKELGIPLYSYVYEGNKNDQTIFPEYIEELEKRIPNYNPGDITLVFDGGSNTKNNLENLKSHYICSFSLSYCKELYDIDINEYSEVKVNDSAVKYYRTTKTIWGKKRTCILTFSKDLYNGQLRGLEEDIKKATNELNELNIKLKNPKTKTKIEKNEDGLKNRVDKILNHKYISDIIDTEIINNVIKYKIEDSKKQEIINKYFGKKLTITDRGKWDTKTILKTYYGQDCIEKIFRSTKNKEHFSLQPIYHWTDQKIRVHIFICLLGLTLASVLQKELKDKEIDISKDKLLKTLSKIRECWVTENNSKNNNIKITKKLEEMDDLQLKILDIINKL